jgi:putative selenium metabolism protein SsnA
MHFYSAFATGMPLPPFPKGFVEVLENLWWKLDKALLKDDIYYSALLGYIQAIKHGTTTVIDHHASPSYITGSLNLIEKAARELGVRSNLCYEVTNRNGDEGADEGLKENEKFIKKCQSSKDDLISGLLGLHASFTVTDESLARSQEIVEKYNTGIHIHVAEGKADMEQARKEFNSTVIERLAKFNLLNPKSILAHCIHLEENDYPIIQKSKPNIVHQPRSNMNNAVGALDIWKLQEKNIPFGLGTDGMSADMKVELLVGPLLQKLTQGNNTIGTVELFNALFKENSRLVKSISGVETGCIDIGKKADVLITGYYPRSPINSDNVIGHIMFGVLNEPIATTMINGQICMNEGVIQKINETEIAEKCQELAPKMWERVR